MRLLPLIPILPSLPLLPLLILLTPAAPRAAETPAPLTLSGDGQEVINPRARLVWSRCVEGMAWNGKSCIGDALRVTHSGAMALAAERRRADGVNWRLPRTGELQRLVNHSAGSSGMDPALFPAAPSDWHWTSTATVDTTAVNQYSYGNIARGVTGSNVNRLAFLHGWAVNTSSGEARGDVSKKSVLPVRLVRTMPR